MQIINKGSNKKGFTLIELVIVIAVLAILAIIAIPVVGGIIDDANDSVDSSNLALYQSAIEMHKAKNGAYPASPAAAITAIQTYAKVTLDGTVLPAPKGADSNEAFTYSAGKVEIKIPATPTSDAISKVK